MKQLLNILICACALALASCVGDGKVNDSSNNPSEEKGALKLNVATRTTEGGVQRDYTLNIYKNEGGKATIVRKYDSAREDMQKPEYIWLLEGNYTAKVESGAAVSTTFNETESYFYGEKSFDIVAGSVPAQVDVVAILQNIPVEVVFDQTIVDGFLDGYKVDVKANNKVKLTYTESKTGYFIMPQGVTTLSWNFVGTFEYEDGEQVAINKSGTLENVAPKKGYKLSFKFSKDAAGLVEIFPVVVDKTVDERDDHISFNPDPELRGDGFNETEVFNYSSSKGVRRYVATSPEVFTEVTIVAGGKEYNPVSENVAGVSLEGLNTTQLYVALSEDFFNTLPGGAQVIELCVVDASGGTARKELPYNLQGVKVYDRTTTNLWTGVASLSATVFETPKNVELIYREGEGEWKHFAATSSGANTYTAQVEGIGAGHTYEYNLVIGGKTVGTSKTFTTIAGAQIPNGDMEIWNESGKAYYPGASSSNKYWDTGNPGTTTLSGGDNNLTCSSSDVHPGTKGRRSAFLDSKEVLGQFGAGNIYVGTFGKVNITSMSATVYFGQPFEYNAKPKGVRFWVKYRCGSIDKVGTNPFGISSGNPDLTKIFCCIATDQHLVDSDKGDETTFSPSAENVKANKGGRYDKVLYYAYFDSTTSNESWHEVYLPFTKVDGVDPAKVGTHLMFTATCSGYGDYFTGSTDSWMYIDDIELVY